MESRRRFLLSRGAASTAVVAGRQTREDAIQQSRLESFKQVVRRLVLEAATHRSINCHRLFSEKASEVAEEIIKEFAGWWYTAEVGLGG